MAGPVTWALYAYWARKVDPAIVDVYVGNDTDSKGAAIGGTWRCMLLTDEGVPGSELVNQVQAALSAERLRPLRHRDGARPESGGLHRYRAAHAAFRQPCR